MTPAASLPPCSPSARYDAAPMCASARASGVAKGQDLLIRLFDAVTTWQERASDRRHLAGLDERMLRDMGIDPADAFEEAEKPFWRR